MAFPSTLHRMLEEMEAAGQSFIVGWLPHGRAFKVHDPKAFFERVLPLYFKLQSSYTSFQRQLNNYGFQRLVGPHHDQNAYFHECFLRGRVHLCTLMTRCSASATGVVRCTFDPKTEPDFYAMPPLPSCMSPIATNASENSNGLSRGLPNSANCIGMNTMTGGSAIETDDSSQTKLPPSHPIRTKKVTYPRNMPWLPASLASTANASEIDWEGEVAKRNKTQPLVAFAAPLRNAPLSYTSQGPTHDVPVPPSQSPRQAGTVGNDEKNYGLQANSLISALSGRVPIEQSNVAFVHSLQRVDPPIAASPTQFDSLRGPKISTPNRSLTSARGDDDTAPLALSNVLFAVIPDSYSIPPTVNGEGTALNLVPAALYDDPMYQRDRQVYSSQSSHHGHPPPQPRLDPSNYTESNRSDVSIGHVGRSMTDSILSTHQGAQFPVSHQALNQRTVLASRTQLAEPSGQMLTKINAAAQPLFLSSNVRDPIPSTREHIHGSLPFLTHHTLQRNDRQGSMEPNNADHFQSNHDGFNFNTSIPQSSIQIVEASRYALPRHRANSRTPRGSVKESSAMPSCLPLDSTLQVSESTPYASLDERFSNDTKPLSQQGTPPVDLFDDPSILFNNNDDDSLSQSCGSTFSKTHAI
jgi:HSF-type DNA-binding